MSTTHSDSESPNNSNYAFPGTVRLAIAEELDGDDDEPPGSSCRGPRRSEVTTVDDVEHVELQVQDGSEKHSGAVNVKTVRAVDQEDAAVQVDVASIFQQLEAQTSPVLAGLQDNSRRTGMSGLRSLFVPSRPIGPSPGYLRSVKSAIVYTPLNVLLAFIPVSWALHYANASDTVTFVCSALAIVPLAAQLTLATEQIALRTSQSVGGLVNATFGNIVEMIIAGIALNRCDLALVQSSLIGGLISNLLLVLGMAFIVGGYRFHQQEFRPMAAQLNSSLMTVAVISLLVPAGFHEFLGDRLKGDEGPLLLQLSRGSAIVLILIYFAYLVFQFYSHNDIFIDTYELKSLSSSSRSSLAGNTDHETILPVVDPLIMPIVVSPYETPKVNGIAAVGILVLATALTYLTADILVSSLNGMVEHSNVSKEWITLIIIPIISNAAEHTTAVIVASKGKFDLMMSVAVGSCVQIALFVIPILVIIAWGLGKPLTLLFDPIETLCLFLSVLLVKFSIEDGRSHWMSGVALTGVYILIAISFWDYPRIDSSPLTCI